MQRAEPPSRSPPHRPDTRHHAPAATACGRLRHMNARPAASTKRAPSFVARPCEHRIPVPRLPRDQTRRRVGAIEQQIGAEIFRDLLRHRRRRIGDRVDDRVGEPRQRHRGRIDHVALRVPFRRDRFGERARRRGQRAARRRSHRLAVEQDREAAVASRRPPARL